MKHIFIINPKAGKKDETEEITRKVKSLLKEDEYEIYTTKSPLDATSFVKKRCEGTNEKLRFYACGGDGTLNEVANGAALKENVEITAYPSGSGNDFLKYFKDVNKFLDLEKLINGKTIECDLLSFNDKYILNIFNLGFDADVVIRMERYKHYPLVSGKVAYNLGVLVTVLKKTNNLLKVKIDGEEVFDGNAMLLTVSNAICYGGGYYCAPRAKIDDGLIDFCLVKKISKFTFAKMVNKYKKGLHLDDPKIQKVIVYKQGKVVEITGEKAFNYTRDGEVGSSNNIKIEMVHNALRFVIPE